MLWLVQYVHILAADECQKARVLSRSVLGMGGRMFDSFFFFLAMNCLYKKTVSERGETSSVSRNIYWGEGSVKPCSCSVSALSKLSPNKISFTLHMHKGNMSHYNPPHIFVGFL